MGALWLEYVMTMVGGINESFKQMLGQFVVLHPTTTISSGYDTNGAWQKIKHVLLSSFHHGWFL